MTINYYMTEKHFKYILLSILVIVFVVAINNPVEVFPDSEGYLNMEIYRSAGYPVFLWILKSISGSYLDLATIFVQLLIGMFAIYSFVSRLKKLLVLHPFWYLLLTLIIAIPYVHNHQVGNSYLSEALTYPLYLLVTIGFLESVVTQSIRKIWLSLPILLVLIITRSQFLFMVPIAILIIIWISLEQKTFKKNTWLFLVLLAFPILTSILDKGYHQLKHGHFVNTPWTGIHLLTPAFYVADENDYSLYDNPEQIQFFKYIYVELNRKNLNIHNLDQEGQVDETAFYIEHFSEIANHTIFDSGKVLVGTNLSTDEQYISVDKLTKKMSFPLILDNIEPWSKIYIKNSIHAFGNSRYALLYLIIFIFGIVGVLKTERVEYRLITLLSLFTFGNVALVAIGMHTIKRFTFYNDWVLFFILFILMDGYLKHRKSSV